MDSKTLIRSVVDVYRLLPLISKLAKAHPDAGTILSVLVNY